MVEYLAVKKVPTTVDSSVDLRVDL